MRLSLRTPLAGFFAAALIASTSVLGQTGAPAGRDASPDRLAHDLRALTQAATMVEIDQQDVAAAKSNSLQMSEADHALRRDREILARVCAQVQDDLGGTAMLNAGR